MEVSIIIAAQAGSERVRQVIERLAELRLVQGGGLWWIDALEAGDAPAIPAWGLGRRLGDLPVPQWRKLDSLQDDLAQAGSVDSCRIVMALWPDESADVARAAAVADRIQPPIEMVFDKLAVYLPCATSDRFPPPDQNLADYLKILALPEDLYGPGHFPADLHPGEDHRPGTLDGHIAGHLLAAAGVWSAQSESAYEEDLTKQYLLRTDVAVVSRVRTRAILGDEVVDSTIHAALDRAGLWPVPERAGQRYVVADNPAAVVQDVLQELGNDAELGFRYNRPPALKLPLPEPWKPLRALRELILFVGERLQKLPGEVIDKTVHKIQKEASRVAEVLTGLDGPESTVVIRWDGQTTLDDSYSPADERREVAGAEALLAALDRPRMVEPCPQAWRTLRQSCFALVDGGDLPSGIKAPMLADARQVLRDPAHLAPPPGSALDVPGLAGLQPSGRIDACDSAKTERLEATLEQLAAEVSTEPPAEVIELSESELSNSELSDSELSDEIDLRDKIDLTDGDGSSHDEIRLGDMGADGFDEHEDPATYPGGVLADTEHAEVATATREPQVKTDADPTDAEPADDAPKPGSQDPRALLERLRRWRGEHGRDRSLLWLLTSAVNAERQAAIKDSEQALDIIRRHAEASVTSAEELRRSRRRVLVWWAIATACLVVAGGLAVGVLGVLAGFGLGLVALAVIIVVWLVALAIRFLIETRNIFTARHQRDVDAAELSWAMTAYERSLYEVQRLGLMYDDLVDWADIISSVVHAPWRASETQASRSQPAEEAEIWLPSSMFVACGSCDDTMANALRQQTLQEIIAGPWLSQAYDAMVGGVRARLAGPLKDADDERFDPDLDTRYRPSHAREAFLGDLATGTAQADARRSVEKDALRSLVKRPIDELVTRLAPVCGSPEVVAERSASSFMTDPLPLGGEDSNGASPIDGENLNFEHRDKRSIESRRGWTHDLLSLYLADQRADDASISLTPLDVARIGLNPSTVVVELAPRQTRALIAFGETQPRGPAREDNGGEDETDRGRPPV